jgi:hypothetical protein
MSSVKVIVTDVHILEIIAIQILLLNETAVDPTLDVWFAVSYFTWKDYSSINIIVLILTAYRILFKLLNSTFVCIKCPNVFNPAI